VRRLFPLSLAVLLSSSSCSFFAVEEDALLLCPTPPVPWQIAFPHLGFRIVTTDWRGRPCVTEIADWRSPARFRCPRAVNTPIVAWPYEPGNSEPRAGSPGILRPAGGFLPFSLRASGDREVIVLSWEEGPAALVAARVQAEGRDISRFNVSRLCEFLGEHADPWALDLDFMAQRIAQGEFSAWDIDRLPCRDTEVEPGPGTWFLESPFLPTFVAADGRVLLPQVTRGTHFLFSTAGSSWRMQSGENESVLVNRDLRDAKDAGLREGPG
jgi:hypothetical protein